MSLTERIFSIHRLLHARRAPTLNSLVEKLEVSRATVKRDIEYMRDRLHAPIRYDASVQGYRYHSQPGEPPYELPGLWFSSEEMHALLVMQDMLAQLQSGLLGEPLHPLRKKIESLLEKAPMRQKEVARRFRILGARVRPVDSRHFQIVSTATLQRKRLLLRYFSRARNEEGERTVSPQRLIWYNNNWYLVGWCHVREDLRNFALDSVVEARLLPERAIDVDTALLDEFVGSGYGIFAGPARHTAVLRFRPPAARWVAKENWHPDQRVIPGTGGDVVLEVPYSDPREILMDILRYGEDVVVEAPASLREAVLDKLRAASERYAMQRRSPRRAMKAGG